MGVTDWEPRALPSEARCKEWAKLGGVWVSAADGFGSFRGKEHRTFYREPDRPMWRPWKDNNPATWSDFYAATHPPIPEGWEACFGGWHEFVADHDVTFGTSGVIRFWDDFTLQDRRLHAAGDRSWSVEVRRILPAIPAGWEAVGEWHDTLSPCSEVYDWTLLQDGRIVQRGETFRGKDERIMGVHIRRVFGAVDWGDVPMDIKILPLTARALGVWRGDTQIGVAVQQEDGKWELQKMNLAGKYANQPSLPAAIVALTGRRDE